MLQYNESDLFIYMNKNDGLQLGLKKSLRSITPENVMNDKLGSSINALSAINKESVIVKVVKGINNGEIVLVNFSPDTSLPAYMPFIKVKLNGKEVVVVDVSRFTTVSTDRADNVVGYKCDAIKLYNAVVPAYIALKIFGSDDTLPYPTIEALSKLWARTFCNLLMSNAMGVLQNHSERYQAFMYFAIRFFCTYYLQIPESVTNKVSMAFVENDKSAYILYIEDRLNATKTNIYGGLTQFITGMMNNDITNLNTNGAKSFNMISLLSLYKNSYSMNALMGLCSPDYFFAIIFNAFNKSNYVRDRGFEVIIDGVKGEYKREVPKMISDLYKEV